MMAWVSAAPAFLAAVAVATLPGMPAAWALRFRGLPFLAVSVAASFAAIGIASLLAPVAGLGWGPLPLLIVAAAIALVLLPLRRFVPPATGAPFAPGAPRRTGALVLTGALLLAAGLIGQEIARAIGDPANMSQTYDGVFHLNAVAHILAGGDASPLHMNLAYPERSVVFYPTLWHATAALVAQLSGASAAVATNATALAVAAWVWPVAILFFAGPFFVRRPAHLLLGGALASVFTAFPYLLLAWGVLYPNFLAAALMPVALGLVHLALRRGALPAGAPGAGHPLPSLWIAAAGAVGAAVLAHPNALFGLAALAVPLLAAAALDLRRAELPRKVAVWRWIGLGAAALAVAALWVGISAGESRRYDSNLLRGAVSALSNAPLVEAKAWFLTILVLSGIALLLVARRHRWLIASYAIAVALFAVTVGLEGPLRDFLTGAWYNDAARIAALLPIAALPLAGVAGALLLDGVDGAARELGAGRAGARARRLLPAVATAAVLALVLVGARGGSIPAQSGWVSQLYAVSDDSPLLSPDELALLERLDEEVPADALIAGDPWTGTALALAVADREVLFPHMRGSFGAEAQELATGLRELDEREACALLEGLGVDFVLDFGGPVYDTGNAAASAKFDGLRGVGGSPALEQADREGEASLYRVAC